MHISSRTLTAAVLFAALSTHTVLAFSTSTAFIAGKPALLRGGTCRTCSVAPHGLGIRPELAGGRPSARQSLSMQLDSALVMEALEGAGEQIIGTPELGAALVDAFGAPADQFTQIALNIPVSLWEVSVHPLRFPLLVCSHFVAVCGHQICDVRVFCEKVDCEYTGIPRRPRAVRAAGRCGDNNISLPPRPGTH